MRPGGGKKSNSRGESGTKKVSAKSPIFRRTHLFLIFTKFEQNVGNRGVSGRGRRWEKEVDGSLCIKTEKGGKNANIMGLQM